MAFGDTEKSYCIDRNDCATQVQLSFRTRHGKEAPSKKVIKKWLHQFLTTVINGHRKRPDVYEFLMNALGMYRSVFDIALRSPCAHPHYHCEVGDYLNLALPQLWLDE
ncbi:hypothetical protein ANN_15209 [Periplaneta americana]|uniref:Uncharacterized protein n=1 Tax=Periplaneta americana TaxID=6978 RepID=A0ABQ8SGZ1_PERAM|nr:hypothetical protein ANN_15209 [Periplaneta americana]